MDEEELKQYKRDHIKQRRQDPKYVRKERDYYKKWMNEIKLEALVHYGGQPPKCACCGETTIQFLTLDHIYNDGAEQRRQLKTYTGRNFARWLKSRKYPPGIQVLCWNCNCGKVAGICPHKFLKT